MRLGPTYIQATRVDWTREMASEIETLNGEVVPEAATGKALNGQQLQAAALEAAGATRKAIAEAVGVSTGAISVWRRDPAYQAEIERLGQATNDQLHAAVVAVQAEIVSGVSAAVKALTAALGAETSEGQPLWGVRHDAASKLLQHGAKLVEPKTTEAAATGPAQAIQINIDTSKPPAPPA
jgi:hypothetical protein